MTLNDLVDGWFEEVGVGYAYLYIEPYESSKELGHAYAYDTGDGYGYRIVINSKFDMDSFLGKCIAWHEFCHCWDFAISGTMGHGMKWIKKLLSKPIYAIGPIALVFVIINKMST